MLGSILSTIGNVAGGLFGAKYNAKKQEEFAKHSLGWKLEDAEKHGVSKYFAAGAPTSNFAPVSVGGMDFSNLGNALDKQMGQGGAGSTTTGKVSGIAHQIQQAQLDGLRVDNDIKRAELASKTAIAGQPGAGGVLDRDVTFGPTGAELKKNITPAGFGEGNKSFGVTPEVDMYRAKDGYYIPAPPQQLSEVHENNAVMRWQWMIRNQLAPYYYDSAKTVPYEAPSGSFWSYDPLYGGYVLVKKGGRQGGSRPEGWEYITNKLRR